MQRKCKLQGFDLILFYSPIFVFSFIFILSSEFQINQFPPLDAAAANEAYACLPPLLLSAPSSSR